MGFFSIMYLPYVAFYEFWSSLATSFTTSLAGAFVPFFTFTISISCGTEYSRDSTRVDLGP
jgi:hypothetical protein